MDVMERQRLTEVQIEELAVEIREFLLEHGLWPETGRYFYNDREHLFVEEDIEPQTYFEYVNPDHILSMSFEGPVCEMLYYGERQETRKKFDAIFERYGLYYEFGNHWNFSCYYI